MDTLTEEQEKLVETLLEEVRSFYKGEYPSPFNSSLNDEYRHILAYKYLKARHWNLKHALEMVKATAVFREEQKVDDMALFPCTFATRGYDEEDLCKVLSLPYSLGKREFETNLQVVGAHHANGYHFWDKEGHPVLYDFIGRTRIPQLLKNKSMVSTLGIKTQDAALQFHIYVNTVQERMLEYVNKKNSESGGPRILGTTVVFDAEGINFGMVSSHTVGFMRTMIHMDQNYYPELVHRIYVINCPSIIMRIYNLIKKSLDVHTREKVVFCDKEHTEEFLRKIIDEDKIPKFFGGPCECVGGCLPGVDVVHTARHVGREEMCPDGDESFVPPSKEVCLGAGKKHHMKIPMKQDDEWQWEFRCTKSSNGASAEIHFLVEFRASSVVDDVEEVQSTEESSKKSVKSSLSPSSPNRANTIKSVKVDKDCGHFKSTEEGTLHLEWDNRSSWFQGKEVCLLISQVKIS